MTTFEYIGLPVVEGAVNNEIHLDECDGVIKVRLPRNIQEKFDTAVLHLGNQSAILAYSSYCSNQNVTFQFNMESVTQLSVFYELFSGVSLLDTSEAYYLKIFPFSLLHRIRNGAPFYLQDLSTLKFLSHRRIGLDTWTGFSHIPSGGKYQQACKLQFINGSIKYVELGFFLCTSFGVREDYFENGLSDFCQDRVLDCENDKQLLSFQWEFTKLTEESLLLYTKSKSAYNQLNLFTPDDSTPTGIAYKRGYAPLTPWKIHV
ncbi:TPA: hypothetical protein PP061_003931 [Salmonella bongori]|uniref:hypothetical protein n=1 Tax=Salmonella bongori TaxID=54736 RepID=UPI000A287F7F|nr:hypothetical protein [Salmonella bongori]ECE6548657.1 hypothetical protein [Salmonella bongori]EDP8577368.1 hypothetical protein [Salmonella bongori]HDJ2747893.1 hypothetical protein [Salmonella bongori]HDJ2754715.1 hypothetical protein [Salmonella bongori]HDJ2763998.1 hypothetical protein [Salmonella bongori]